MVRVRVPRKAQAILMSSQEKAANSQTFYARHIAPYILHGVCSAKQLAEQRQMIVPQAEGVVVEIGIGTGHNLAYYDPAKVKQIIGVDPDESLLRLAKRQAARRNLPVTFLPLGAESLPLESRMADTVVVTYAFCTIPEVNQALAEIRRILKPGGRLLFCEHGLSDNPRTARWQTRLTPLWRKLAGGCHLNRNIAELAPAAGFVFETLETGKLPWVPGILGFHYRGAARPR